LARECNRRHIWVSDKEFCGDYKPRETPLLVDVLAQALNGMIELWNRADDADVDPESYQGFDEVMRAAFAALARHQKEVGDA